MKPSGTLAGLRAMNAPLNARIRDAARKLYGRSDRRSVDAVARAVADLPYAVVRRHAYDEPMPSWRDADVAASARAMLLSPLNRLGERP
jgi:hypothetical protein